MLVPCALVPQLQTIPYPDNHDLPGQPGVLAEEARHHDPPRGVKLGILGASVEEAFELRQLRRERGQLLERPSRVALVLLRTPDPNAGLQVERHCQHHAIGERRTVTGGHRETVLRVERMVEGATEEDHCESSKLGYRAEVEEWEEPLHPGSLARTYPTSSHNATPLAHLFPPRLHGVVRMATIGADRGLT